MVDIGRTFGALMIGGIVAAVFSGMVTSQAFSYFKYYTSDTRMLRSLVALIWFLDFCHTIFITTALWDHLIAHFGDTARIDYIPWSLAITIAFTAVLTFLVHLQVPSPSTHLQSNVADTPPSGSSSTGSSNALHAVSANPHRRLILKVSTPNLLLFFPFPIPILARRPTVTTAKMINLRSFKVFIKLYTWSFSLGLAISSLLDVLITVSLCYLLHKKHKKNSSLNHVLDSLMLYTFENGSITCAATVISLICWLTMHTNLIFMGIHFVISKFYANSFLATLNARKTLHPTGHRAQNSHDRNVPIMFPNNTFGLASNNTPSVRSTSFAPLVSHKLRIIVDETKMSRSDSASAGTTSTGREPSTIDDRDIKSRAGMEVC
ncbi:hypothetical protein CVT25_009768 [Psilocybe cyanescens]|uniref:DUF6534 domain-containing protein n=1 Tax=Psilocybe cyanescens TaxID=93625 RepID=A0A409XQ96_PSICY|nr:hypothetical protein CVT25_009768 [Psilocybe cyanescens]